MLKARAAEREEAALKVLEAQWLVEEGREMAAEDIRSHAMRCVGGISSKCSLCGPREDG